MAHAYIQREDLGLTVLGVTQYGYTVNGVHGQDYDTAIYRAALCRTVGTEDALAAYQKMLTLRQKKNLDLGNALSSLSGAIAGLKETKTDSDVNIGSEAALIFRRYDFEASSTIKYEYAMKLQQNVKYAMDKENNEMQQEMSMLQNFLRKRDESVQMANKLMKKVASTRERGIKNIIG